MHHHYNHIWVIFFLPNYYFGRIKLFQTMTLPLHLPLFSIHSSAVQKQFIATVLLQILEFIMKKSILKKKYYLSFTCLSLCVCVCFHMYKQNP